MKRLLINSYHVLAAGDGRGGVRAWGGRGTAGRQESDGEGSSGEWSSRQHHHQDLLQEFPHPPEHPRGGHRLGALQGRHPHRLCPQEGQSAVPAAASLFGRSIIRLSRVIRFL